ncbi:MAG: tRNA (guanosine(37)-N1)-methyltransferase TrmD [Magnetococcales bacterium]|nr:tRNA (guanosine(37)-N1)-methyltransferase TrmD [Magnetococcales bacterium]
MKFTILTLFPEMFSGFLEHSILKRAQEKGLLGVELLQIRDHATGRHRPVDDTPYGGGPGMVMKVDVLDRALESVSDAPHVVYLTPQGKPFRQNDALRLADLNHVALVCGHYEGIDERFVEARVDEEFSLGDFVLTGGEIPALAIVDAVTRLLPGVLGDGESAKEDSFYTGLLDHPHYTRPRAWQDAHNEQVRAVPDVLCSGNHGAVDQWRRRQALIRTLLRRPDLLESADLTRGERRMMEQFLRELQATVSETPEIVNTH